MADFDQAYFDRYAQQNPDFWNWKSSLPTDPNAFYSYDDAGIQRYNNPADYSQNSQFRLPDGRLASFNGQNYVAYGDAPSNYYDGRNMNAYIYNADGSLASTQQKYDVDRDTAWYDRPEMWGALVIGGLGAYDGLAAGAASGAEGSADYTAATYAPNTAPEFSADAAGSAGSAGGTTAGDSLADYDLSNVDQYGGDYNPNVNPDFSPPPGTSPDSPDWMKKLGSQLANQAAKNGTPSGAGSSSPLGLSTPGLNLFNQAQAPQAIDLMPKFSSAPVAQNGNSDELANSQRLLKLADMLRNGGTYGNRSVYG